MSQRFTLLGHPVAHSLSPAIHRAAYAALGLPHRYELTDAADEPAFAAALAALRSGEVAGANVTIPWKRAALALCDRADASASDVGAANVLVREASGALVAHNTDVPALADEIRARCPVVSTALVLGSGGAALAAVAALSRLGARVVAVSARRFDAARPASEWPYAVEFERLGAVLLPWPSAGSTALSDCAATANVIVQATSAGMHGAAPGSSVADVIPWQRVAKTTLAYDLVYNPAETPFLARARAAGCQVAGGLGMLVGQAALAFELWLGVAPPVDAMRRAAEAELARRTA